MRNFRTNVSNRLSVFLQKFNTLPRFTWIMIITAFLLGIVVNTGSVDTPNNSGIVKMDIADQHEPDTWTCSMHPQIQLPGAGQCPICFMDLIPLETSIMNEGPGILTLSETAVELARIRTESVKRRMAEAEIRLSGRVEMDETRIKIITAWIPGRLERLYVDYTGISVKKGDHLVDIYSPELYSAQEELIQASKNIETTNGDVAYSSHLATHEAAKAKLILLGLTEDQIEQIERRGEPQNQLTIYSPLSGVVMHKNAQEGKYVDVGSAIYTIADLNHVWIVLDGYEKDIPWLKFGQSVTINSEAFPGQSWTGTISFIDPVINQKTRTVRVRVNVQNSNQELKPGMFVKADIRAKLDSRGRVINSELAGKWISPMHPEIVKDEPGNCDVCGMDLVPAESLGIIQTGEDEKLPLLVPASAVLKTGTRSIVYVLDTGKPEPTYSLRELVLGPRAGDYYVVLSGIEEDEVVVTNGNFKIDSAMQIAAKPSMMNPEGGRISTGHDHHGSNEINTHKPDRISTQSEHDDLTFSQSFEEWISPVFESYFDLQSALVNDDLSTSLDVMSRIRSQISSEEMSELSEQNLHAWTPVKVQLLKATEHVHHWNSIDEVRKAFDTLSEVFIRIEKAVGHTGDHTTYEMYCPMAFNNTGAAWLQTSNQVLNPYFGESMLRCGEIISTHVSDVKRKEQAGDSHYE